MFKPGDRVVCVNRRSPSALEIGKEYVVAGCFKRLGEYYVRLEGIAVMHNYSHTRFKPVKVSLENK